MGQYDIETIKCQSDTGRSTGRDSELLGQDWSTAAEDWQRKTGALRTKLLPRPSQRPCGIKIKLSFLDFVTFRGDTV